MHEKLGVIFDMDGVLVDSYDAHREAWVRIASQSGVTMTDEGFAKTFGRTTRELIHQLWPGRFDDSAVRALDVAKEAAYRDVLREHFPEMDGASDLIAALHKAGFALAIGSSGPRENVELIRKTIRHGDFIQAAVNGADVHRGKPDPEIFLVAAGKLGVPPECCAVVEDAPVGLQAARRAGMVAIGLTGTATREALALHAHLVVDHLREVSVAMIVELLGRK
jgi:beta-phosphoglucomutase